MKTINNIEECRVGFTNAKLLKEKGLNMYWLKLAYPLDGLFNGKYYDNKQPLNSDLILLSNRVKVPTQQVALDWIRINFGIHIDCQVEGINLEIYRFICFKTSDERVNEMVKHILDNFHNGRYSTPEEAKESAINYALTNLI